MKANKFKRIDGRRVDQLRKTIIKTGVNRFAEGSCLIQMGQTHVLCTASVESGVPRWMKSSGKGWVTAEYSMLPRSCSSRIPRDITKGKLNGRSQEIQRLIGRSLRTVVDMDALGERTIWIDCDVLQGDGGTRCASITGAYVALAQALQQLVRKKELPKVPLKSQVGAISVGIVDGAPLLDLKYEEDSQADVDMNVVMTGEGEFVELQGTAERKAFSETEMKKMLQLAKKGLKELFQVQRKAVKK